MSEAVHTKSTGFLEPLDSVHPTSVTEANQIDSQNVNSAAVNLQETPLTGNSFSVREHVQLLNEQKPGDVRPASQTPNNESSSCPISPFQVQNNPSLEIILSPSSNIIIEDASTPTNLNSQSIDNVATGIEIAMKYGDDLLVEEVVKSVPKGNSKHFLSSPHPAVPLFCFLLH